MGTTSEYATRGGESRIPAAFGGWLVLAACGLALACGGQTQPGGDSLHHGGNTGSDAHAAADATGGTGGTGGSAHAGAGGVTPLDAGVFDPSCSCPPADYGLDLAGDAPVLRHNAHPNPECDGGPLGAQASESCGVVKLRVSACTGPNGGLPCVSIVDSRVDYFTTGRELYSGAAEIAFDRTSIEQPNGILTGTWHAEPTDERGSTVRLGGRFVLCGRLVRSLAPCP
jgi:hypothetical protein